MRERVKDCVLFSLLAFLGASASSRAILCAARGARRRRGRRPSRRAPGKGIHEHLVHRYPGERLVGYDAFTQFTRVNGMMTASPGSQFNRFRPVCPTMNAGILTFAEYWGTYVLPNINNPRGLCRIDARLLLDAFPRRCKGVNGYPAFGVPLHRAARLGR